MSELMAEIGAEVKRLLDGERTDIARHMSRRAIVQAHGAAVEIGQTKILTHVDAKYIQSNGPGSFITPEWFNDVDWLQQPYEEERSRYRLDLEATYPMEYFEVDEEPHSGNFKGDKWLEQYGSISGFGSGDGISSWLLEFVAPGSRTVTRLSYPDDPTALDQYNARYRQYLQTLTEANPTISYFRSWDRIFSDETEKANLMLGGMALIGFSANDVIVQGSEVEGETDNVSLVFDYESEKDGYLGRDLVITDGHDATTEPYWDGRDDREQASEELLATALELVQNMTVK